ncbi:MAG: HAD family hydrolase [Candidatus Rokubacteria bacterium]|nr:HAD family hydrolase [Candidatus Rokubacteria bacterium]
MPGAAAVLIDRDGTLTEEVGYVNHPKRLRLLPRSAEAVRRLNRSGVKAVMVTNQSGVARGYFTEEVLQAVNEALVSQLKAEGAYLDGLYVCVHHPTLGEPPYRAVCDCRKPEPGLLRRAAADLGLDLSRSWTVGDKISDVLAGRRAGTGSILVLTGYGLGEWEFRRSRWPTPPDHVAEDLLAAVEWIQKGGPR